MELVGKGRNESLSSDFLSENLGLSKSDSILLPLNRFPPFIILVPGTFCFPPFYPSAIFLNTSIHLFNKYGSFQMMNENVSVLTI